MKKILLYIVLIAALVVMAATAVAASVERVPDPRPEPPTIEVYGYPDPGGGEPAACAGEPGCGVMCFYITENAADNQHELSCMAWIFE